MKIFKTRNVHNVFPEAVSYLEGYGLKRDTRVGKVLQAPFPVTTVYEKPCERVLFHPERDANPFFHLYEALWMLGGRNDIAPVLKFNKRWIDFSDDGVTQHAAYGHRWRQHFPLRESYSGDQLKQIAAMLKENPEDRRAVLQMWDCEIDLGRKGKDIPCNLVCTFQIDWVGNLHIVVFCRSNDIIWGCYGANAVHFSMLLEYMSVLIGCKVGTYTQISVNWHAYENVFDKVKNILGYASPYEQFNVYNDEMPRDGEYLDRAIADALMLVDNPDHSANTLVQSSWGCTVHKMLLAHQFYRKCEGEQKYVSALALLGESKVDWIIAGREWIERRYKAWQLKQ